MIDIAYIALSLSLSSPWSATCAAAPCSVAKTTPIFGGKMNAENIVAAVATILLLVYLFYSLLRPEKF